MQKKLRLGELVIQLTLLLFGVLSILITAGIVLTLGEESLRFFASGEISIWKFLTAAKWQPAIGEYGILPLASATLMTSLIAMLIAAPLGLFVAVYLSQYATPRVRAVLKPILEILAGIPTVVYGYFALTFITPLLRLVFGENVVSIYNTASAGIAIGILILPLIASMSEDALGAVPRSLKEAAFALGATKLETSLSVVVPAGISGVAAAFIVGLSRAIGETMTGYIVRISGGDLGYDTVDYNSIFAIGIVLFLITLALNIVSRRIVRRFREVYE